MRDGQIFEMNKRRAQNDVLLYKQFVFLNTRMQAYETVLASRKAMFLAFFSPSWLKEAVDEAQTALLAEHDKAMREAAENQPKVKLSIVGANGISHG